MSNMTFVPVKSTRDIWFVNDCVPVVDTEDNMQHLMQAFTNASTVFFI